LTEADVSKFQTGGPDGDLGSNEVLISKDKTIGVVDGGGVLYDPQGIDIYTFVVTYNSVKSSL
jgi:glutamate dehydrogenase